MGIVGVVTFFVSEVPDHKFAMLICDPTQRKAPTFTKRVLAEHGNEKGVSSEGVICFS